MTGIDVFDRLNAEVFIIRHPEPYMTVAPWTVSAKVKGDGVVIEVKESGKILDEVIARAADKLSDTCRYGAAILLTPQIEHKAAVDDDIPF